MKEHVIISAGGGPIDVGLPSENHHKFNLIASEDPLLTEGVVVPLF